MRYFVTGAAGLVGSHIIQKILMQSDSYVVASDRDNLELTHDRLSFIRSDISNLEKGSVDADVLIHLVGSPGVWFSEKEPEADRRISVDSVEQAFFAMKRCRHAVLASSWQVYGSSDRHEDSKPQPENSYAKNKLAAEMKLKDICVANNATFSILRMSWIYGPKMKKNPIKDIFDGFAYLSMDSMLDFVYVDDVCAAMLIAATDDKWKMRTVNISSNSGTALSEISELFSSFGLNKHIKQLGDRKRHVVIENTLARNLGWQPLVGIKEGLKRTYESFSR